MLVLEKYKLIQVGYPDNHQNWFDGVAAAEFEETAFKSKDDADLMIREMCEAAGTNSDGNYDEFKPIAITVADFNARFGAEVENVFYW